MRKTKKRPIAQLVEHEAFNLEVDGSTPSRPIKAMGQWTNREIAYEIKREKAETLRWIIRQVANTLNSKGDRESLEVVLSDIEKLQDEIRELRGRLKCALEGYRFVIRNEETGDTISFSEDPVHLNSTRIQFRTRHDTSAMSRPNPGLFAELRKALFG